jgi:hypothetical protein
VFWVLGVRGWGFGFGVLWLKGSGFLGLGFGGLGFRLFFLEQ